ncbi:hypothetical protein ABT256_34435 [Amycolatopsis japonica]|uniref:hypothetical protein n=1 Tax=Amycolatopsis japonica TaxID=208439 RepID=UPI003318CF36
MSSSERRNRAATRRAAVEGVAAYLADEDPDVYNITDAAVHGLHDPRGTALLSDGNESAAAVAYVRPSMNWSRL